MKKNVKKACIVTGLLSLIGLLPSCATHSVSDRPSWIDSPARHQAVGSCESHALGRYKQQECALTRARLELAARKGIELKSVSVMTENSTNLVSHSSIDGQVIQEVSTQLKTRLVDRYHDKQRDILWVLVEEN